MQELNKISQSVGIPFSALLSVIFGLMLISFPVGILMVFDSDLGGDITFEYPLNDFDLSLSGIDYAFPFAIELGDAFIVLWSAYAILFAIAVLGPKTNFIKSLSPMLAFGKLGTKSNYMIAITKWFSILILISAIINFLQEGFGIITIPPSVDNDLINFFNLSLSPITEEFGFRVLLIGLPLFAIYSYKSSIKYFFKSLWNPYENLHVSNTQKAIILIIVIGILFGFAHVLIGEPWSEGKFAQATASGIILGWLYFRYGLICAILVHWATNYFIFSYAHFISQLNAISIENAFSHSMMTTMEMLFLISGAFSVAMLIISYFNSKQEEKLEI